jgi:hypothetical protein
MPELNSIVAELQARFPRAKKFAVVSLGFSVFAGSLLAAIERANELAWQNIVVEIIGI